MILVVMQPTYLPWIGYFDLIDQSDVFVFLDTVQFTKQSWQQRNRIKTQRGARWLTVPVYQSMGQRIIDVRINNTMSWRRKHWMTLMTNYRKSKFWPIYGPQLAQAYEQEWDNLADLNLYLIGMLCEMLGLTSRFERTSHLPPLGGRKVEPLVALCKQFAGTVYLSPGGARDYLKSDELFEENGVCVRFQHYEHPLYPQLYGEFIPYLSVIDLVMNTGPEALDIMRSGRRAWRSVEEGVLLS